MPSGSCASKLLMTEIPLFSSLKPVEEHLICSLQLMGIPFSKILAPDGPRKRQRLSGQILLGPKTPAEQNDFCPRDLPNDSAATEQRSGSTSMASRNDLDVSQPHLSIDSLSGLAQLDQESTGDFVYTTCQLLPWWQSVHLKSSILFAQPCYKMAPIRPNFMHCEKAE